MTVFLTILKIIGLILLGIIGLVILILALVLFVPVRYRVAAHVHEKDDIAVKGQISWLLHLVQLALDYKESHAIAYMRILFFRKKLWEFPEAEEEQTESDETSQLTEEAQEDRDDIRQEALQPDAENESEDEDLDEDADEELPSVLEQIEPKKKRDAWYQRMISKIKSMIASVRGMIKNIRKTSKRILKEVTDEKNQEAVFHIRDEIFYLLKKLTPKKFRLKAAFSAGSPDLTGQVLGVLTLFPTGYQNRWQIFPDFEAEQFYIDGDTSLQGKIQLVFVVGMVIRLMKDENCRRLYHKVSK